MIQLTKQQNQLLTSLLSKLNDSLFGPHRPIIATVGGYAGTGKTTLIGELRREILRLKPRSSVAFVTFTGKASSVLKNKLELSGALYNTNDYCGTIHGLIYSPICKWDKQLNAHMIIGWTLKDIDSLNYYDLIIIDEASMVSREIWNDLLSFERSIIAFGDHGQLPPIGDNNFNLMRKPHFILTEIHRQSLNSPIIKLSQIVRNEGYIPSGFQSNEVFKLSWRNPKCQRIWNEKVNFIENELVILCGFNTTRTNLNKMIREKLSYKEFAPYPNEKIVCLNNNHEIKIMNGQIGKVIWVMVDEDSYRITVEIDNDIYECFVSKRCFGQATYTIYDKSKKSRKLYENAIEQGFSRVDFFDYGYVISVHKSQGSEWDKVILFEQRTQKWDDDYYMKWLYTAITRSRRKLFVISDAWI